MDRGAGCTDVNVPNATELHMKKWVKWKILHIKRKKSWEWDLRVSRAALDSHSKGPGHLQLPSHLGPGEDEGAAPHTPPSPSTIPYSGGSSSCRELPHTFRKFLERETMEGLSPTDSCFLPFKQHEPQYSLPNTPSHRFPTPTGQRRHSQAGSRDLGPSSLQGPARKLPTLK